MGHVVLWCRAEQKGQHTGPGEAYPPSPAPVTCPHSALGKWEHVTVEEGQPRPVVAMRTGSSPSTSQKQPKMEGILFTGHCSRGRVALKPSREMELEWGNQVRSL